MRRNAPVPKKAVRQLTAWRRTAIGIVSVICLMSLSSPAIADVGRPSLAGRGVSQPTGEVPAGTDDTHVSFRVVTDGETVPVPPPPQPPQPPQPHPPIASTGLNMPVAELIGLALGLLVLGLVIVAIASARRRRTKEHGDG